MNAQTILIVNDDNNFVELLKENIETLTLDSLVEAAENKESRLRHCSGKLPNQRYQNLVQ